MINIVEIQKTIATGNHWLYIWYNLKDPFMANYCSYNRMIMEMVMN